MSHFLHRVLARIGRALRPLFDPDAEARRDALDDLRTRAREAGAALKAQRERVQQLGEAITRSGERTGRELTAIRDLHAQDAMRLREQVVDTRKELARVDARLEALASERVASLEHAVHDIRRGLRRQDRRTEQLLDRAIPGHILDESRVLARLARIARRGGPIIVGPWTGEVGFELLYWAPFVRWFASHYGIDPARLFVVSRGGTASWYGVGRYGDALDWLAPEEFRAANDQEQKKQRRLQRLDRHLLRRARVAAGMRRASVLHPEAMYRLFMPFWHGDEPAFTVLRRTLHQPLSPPADVELPPLPERYVAVRFYYSSCFPDTPETRQFVGDTIRALAETTDVVLLDPGVRVDDHADAAPARHPRVHRIAGHVDPARNLALQSAVMARATRFVGTYGGFAYLAPLYGVHATGVYAVENFTPTHRDFSDIVFRRIDGGRLTVLSIGEAAFLGRLLAGVHPIEPPARLRG